MIDNLETRPASENDLAWLMSLRVATMAEYLEQGGLALSAADHRGRVLHDFESIRIIQLDQCDVGMVKLVRKAPVWNLIQIQILPAWQRRGIATQLISEIIVEAEEAIVSLKLSVLKVNPARSLYERLGFRVVEETDHSFRMLIPAQ